MRCGCGALCLECGGVVCLILEYTVRCSLVRECGCCVGFGRVLFMQLILNDESGCI